MNGLIKKKNQVVPVGFWEFENKLKIKGDHELMTHNLWKA